MKRSVFLAVFILFLFGAIAFALSSVFPTASNQGYAPEQPIPFSHKLHAGTLSIDCRYCHIGPTRARHSTVPALNVCMNCHRVVRLDSPYVQKLVEHFESKQPVEWVRIHELPDYVHFPHKQHLAKGLVCEDCHGDVKKMEVMEQKSPLTMGWCMRCHRGQTAPEKVRKQILGDGKEGLIASVNCTTCHN